MEAILIARMEVRSLQSYWRTGDRSLSRTDGQQIQKLCKEQRNVILAAMLRRHAVSDSCNG